MKVATPDLVKTAVQLAIEGLDAQYGCEKVHPYPDGQGGAWVTIDEVELGPPYGQPDTTVICLLPFNLPNADVYPIFVRTDLSRADNQPLGEGFQQTAVQLPGEPTPRQATQVSRRTRNGQFTDQTATLKIEKVLAWIRGQ